MMAVNFCLSSINPIQYDHPAIGRASVMKSQMQSNHTFCPLRGSACTPYSCTSLWKISSGIFCQKPRNFFGDFIETKTVKTDDDEVLSFVEEEIAINIDWTDEDDEGAPWEGAVVFRRSSSIAHVEYCTTLERLGLSKISSELSRSRALAMGLRIIKPVKDYLDGTPVLISVDVTKKKQKLRLDRIIKTVITLAGVVNQQLRVYSPTSRYY